MAGESLKEQGSGSWWGRQVCIGTWHFLPVQLVRGLEERSCDCGVDSGWQWVAVARGERQERSG